MRLLILSLLAFPALAAELGVPLTSEAKQSILKSLFEGTKAKIQVEAGEAIVRSRFKELLVERLEGSEKEPCGAATVRVVMAFRRGESDPAARFVLTATTCEERVCMACGAFLAVAPMRQDGKVWKRDGDYKFRETYGTLGELPQAPEAVRLAPARTALRFEAGGMHQGYVSAGTSFYAVEEDGNLRHVSSIVETVSNEGTCEEGGGAPCFAKKIDVRVTDRMTNGWKEIEARIEGTEIDEKTQKLQKVLRTDVYRYDGRGYEKK